MSEDELYYLINNPDLEIIDDEDELEEKLEEKLYTLSLREAIAAICEGNIAKVKEFAKDETQINSFCEYRNYMTPLAVAVEYGNFEIIKILLDNGADPYLRITGRCQQYAKSVSPLTLAKRKAAQEGYDKIIELLEEACKKKDLEYANEVCETLSSSHDREFIMDYIRSNIIDCGADVNMRDANGNTPLLALLKKYYMVISNSADCRELELLLESGANPNVCNNEGWTPLTETIWTSEARIDPCNCYHGFGADCTPVVKLLVKNGADFSYAMCADFEKASVVMQLLKEDEHLNGVREFLSDKYNFNAE